MSALVAGPSRRRIPGLSRDNLPLLATVVVTALLYVAAAASFKGFATAHVFLNFLCDNAFLGVAAVGMTFVILSGGIDLSVGAVIACTSILLATLVKGSAHLPGMHPVVAIVAVLVLGTLFGTAQGALIRYFNLPAFLITLAGLFFCRAALLISRESLSIDHSFYTMLSEVSVLMGRRILRPLPGAIFVAALIAGVYVARWTRFGRNCYALGGNEQSAGLMGLPVGPTKVAVYALSGFCSALAGVVFTIFLKSGDATAAAGLELDAIAAVVMGGTLLSGGSGSLVGTLMGVLIYAIMMAGITFKGDLNAAWTKITTGLLLLAFILLQKVIQRKGR